jgi:microcystin degradation protein MlrC
MAFAVKYFPHDDEYLQGERAARALVRAIRGDFRPTHVTVRVPVISPGVLQWTGASPWMDLVQRALVWEAREPDTYVNIFFGFPFADVPDVGMTVQVLTNSNPELAKQVGRDLARAIWRQREALLNSTRIHTIANGVALAKQAVLSGHTPVVLADHSDRSGAATWLLREIIAQDLSNTLIATIADADATARLKAMGAKEGDRVDIEVGGLVDESAGLPVRIQGTIRKDVEGYGQFWVCIDFGRNNVLILSTYLVQIMEPFSLKALGLNIASFEVMAIKSRVHFRRGFDDNGFAKTILLVEPEQPFLGTTHLDKLPYQNVDLTKYYPYGNPVFSA